MEEEIYDIFEEDNKTNDWKEIHKPLNFEGSKLSDCINFLETNK